MVCLAWPEHRRVPLSFIESVARKLGLYGAITCLDPRGRPMSPAEGRSEDPVPEEDPEVVTQSLSALRAYMGRITQGRILIGGKRHGFQGAMPGILEEALMALEMHHPVFLAGGFGGATLDMVRAFVPAAAAWASAQTVVPPMDPRSQRGLDRLSTLIGVSGWSSLNNGLDEEENKRLAATHRPTEIAALVSLGLGRLSGSQSVQS
jgi:SLOG cluster2